VIDWISNGKHGENPKRRLLISLTIISSGIMPYVGTKQIKLVLVEGKLDQFPQSIEPDLLSLGLPTSVQKEVVTLIKEYAVCKKGQVLNANEATILKLLEKPMAELKILLD
ncbi:unnamed protein product, partial [Allacma fusca]